MTERNNNLKDVLHQWRNIDPRPGFEGRVWRRIHAVTPSRVYRNRTEWISLQPVYAHAALLVIGAALGIAVFFALSHSSMATGTSDFHIFRAGSVAGSYVQMISGAGS